MGVLQRITRGPGGSGPSELFEMVRRAAVQLQLGPRDEVGLQSRKSRSWEHQCWQPCKRMRLL
eukprot:6217447-Alexandrium_andersonii.AAC.1